MTNYKQPHKLEDSGETRMSDDPKFRGAVKKAADESNRLQEELAEQADMVDVIMREFDEIGFGNQAQIIGAKRVELKDWITQKLTQVREDSREEVAESLRMDEMKSKFKKSEGYNQAVQELNTKIDEIINQEK